MSGDTERVVRDAEHSHAKVIRVEVLLSVRDCPSRLRTWLERERTAGASVVKLSDVRDRLG